MSKKICIYHGNCADGFGAACAVRYYAKNQKDLDNREFYPGIYGQPAPDVTDKEVYIVDYSYPKDVIMSMAAQAKTLVILDHHKSAEADLADLRMWNIKDIEQWKYKGRPLGAVFDMERSGAMIAWNFFMPHMEAPALIHIIQDRDLWTFKLPYTRDVQSALFSYPYDFEVWDKLIFEADWSELAEEGEAIERKHFKDINELLALTKRRMNIGGHNVPVANLPYTMSSDAGHIMGAGEPFAACYFDQVDKRTFSLRSAPDGVDVSEIAVKFGGGGHKHAAGFSVPLGWEGDQDATL